MNMRTPFLYSQLVSQPWGLIHQLQDELNRVVGDTLSEVSEGYPPLNLWYNEREAIVTAELPGVAQTDLDITVTGNTLSLRGERHELNTQNGTRVIRQERGAGSFGRNIKLPFEVDQDRVEAQLKDGLLTLTLPRRAEETPKKLEIKTN